jgi:cyclophilin family peptidyl-prolyl cis-trans isomerase
MTEPTGSGPAPEEGSSLPSFLSSTRVKQLAIGLIVLLVLASAYFIWRGIEDDQANTRWDEYFALREEHEPERDPLWNDPYGVHAAQRDRYTKALENFLDEQIEDGVEGALVPQVRWRIARVLADHILSMQSVLDPEKRRAHYERALEHLTAIRDEHPDFPLNWEMFSDGEFPSVTRRLITWFEQNQEWESKYFPRDKAPDGDHTVVLRTTRGDIHFRLYASDAPTWTKNFIARAVSGFYDGTAFYERREVGDALSPGEKAIRGGAARSRGLPVYQWQPLVDVVEGSAGGGQMPEESRNLIPFERGIVAAWHDKASNYDDPQELLIAVDRSPELDYEYTPVGKVTDADSLATLDRIFEGRIWRDDAAVSGEEGARPVLDGLQVPVVIKKALVFDADGALVLPGAGESLSSKAEVESGERRLDGLEKDAYLEQAPEAPTEDGDEEDEAPAPGDGADSDG